MRKIPRGSEALAYGLPIASRRAKRLKREPSPPNKITEIPSKIVNQVRCGTDGVLFRCGMALGSFFIEKAQVISGAWYLDCYLYGSCVAAGEIASNSSAEPAAEIAFYLQEASERHAHAFRNCMGWCKAWVFD